MAIFDAEKGVDEANTTSATETNAKNEAVEYIRNNNIVNRLNHPSSNTLNVTLLEAERTVEQGMTKIINKIILS